MCAINTWMSRARHLPLAKQVFTLSAKLRGHYNYYGVRRNSGSITRFHREVRRLWRRWLCPRSQRAVMNWETFVRKILKKYPLPPPYLPVRPRQLRLANL